MSVILTCKVSHSLSPSSCYSHTTNRVVSQGGALSLFTGLQSEYPEPLAGVLCMSGYLPNPDHLKLSSTAKATPVLQCHGEDDPMVRISWAESARDTLRAAGVESVEWKSYPGLQHSANMDELEDVRAWLGRHLPPPSSYSSRL